MQRYFELMQRYFEPIQRFFEIQCVASQCEDTLRPEERQTMIFWDNAKILWTNAKILWANSKILWDTMCCKPMRRYFETRRTSDNENRPQWWGGPLKTRALLNTSELNRSRTFSQRNWSWRYRAFWNQQEEPQEWRVRIKGTANKPIK